MCACVCVCVCKGDYLIGNWLIICVAQFYCNVFSVCALLCLILTQQHFAHHEATGSSLRLSRLRRWLNTLRRAEVLQQRHPILSAEVDKLDVLDAIVEENACKWAQHTRYYCSTAGRQMTRGTHPNTLD